MFKRVFTIIYGLYHRGGIHQIVFISFTLSALITIMMAAVTFYMRFSNQIDGSLNAQNHTVVEQANRSLNTYLANMIRLSDSVNFHTIKNTDVASQNISDQLQLLYDANNSYVKNITLFSSNGRIVATAPPAILKSGVDVTREPWFVKALEQTENLHFSAPSVQKIYVDTENQYSWVISLSCAAEITEGKSVTTGVLLIDLRYSGISELFNNINLTNNGYIYLIDRDGRIIYHPKHQLLASGLWEDAQLDIGLASYRDGDYDIDGSNIGGRPGGADAGSGISGTPGDADAGSGVGGTPGGTAGGRPGGGRGISGSRSVIIRSAGYTGWSLIGVIPQRGLTMDSQQNILFMLAISLLYFSIIVLVNFILANRLTDPIKKLELSVQQAELGLAGPRIYSGGSHEIRQLGRSIQQMVDLMRKLTDEIVEEQTKKQKSELNALQAQINPHFLYNTLDSLVWMIEKGNPDDALKIVSALARFFRLSLSKGMNIITVRDELEHARNYLMIQKMRYRNKFDYIVEAEDATLELSSIKLVLQPIVENAIYHSMDYMLDGEGLIRVSAKLEGGDLRLCVEDNGLGMSPEAMEQMFTKSTPGSPGSGIGIKNVNDRIKLYFGDAYGVSIESEPDEGARVTLRMPAVKYTAASEPS